MLPANAIDFYGLFSRFLAAGQSVPGHAQELYPSFALAVNIIAVLGLVIAFIMLIALVYVSIRLEQLEHHGFHHREMAEHITHEAHVASRAKNPRWENVAVLASSSEEGDWRRAILEADILLAELLTHLGYPGNTLGEQLKMANPIQFTTIDIAWEAHRMRNALAHLGEAFPLSERDARATIEQYRRVFEEFDYI